MSVHSGKGLASYSGRFCPPLRLGASDFKMKTQRVRNRVLLVHYSQSGRTSRLARSFCGPLAEDDSIELTELALRPVPDYPFPWGFFDFLDAFPETVQLRPPPLAALDGDETAQFDLIVLTYTVWFLSPSPPVTAFLTSTAGRRLLADTPVITLVGCRNMWMCAHDIVSDLLSAAGARHCDNVVVSDPGPALATFITTPRWMLTGRRDRFLGLPPAGISDADIEGASRFGRAIAAAFEAGRVDGEQPLLTGLRAVTVDDRLLASERIGRRSFMIWSRLVRLFGEPGAFARRPVLLVYSLFLVAMIVTLVPASLLIRRAIRPLRRRHGAAVRLHYTAPSGSGSERMHRFAP